MLAGPRPARLVRACRVACPKSITLAGSCLECTDLNENGHKNSFVIQSLLLWFNTRALNPLLSISISPIDVQDFHATDKFT